MDIKYELTLHRNYRGRVKMSLSSKEETEKPVTKCLLDHNGAHKTEDCRLFGKKNVTERGAKIKEIRVCFNCMIIGHTSRTCRSKRSCSKSDFGKNHLILLHDDFSQGNSFHKARFSAGVSLSSEKTV